MRVLTKKNMKIVKCDDDFDHGLEQWRQQHQNVLDRRENREYGIFIAGSTGVVLRVNCPIKRSTILSYVTTRYTLNLIFSDTYSFVSLQLHLH